MELAQVGGDVEEWPRHGLHQGKAGEVVLQGHPAGGHDLILQEGQNHLQGKSNSFQVRMTLSEARGAYSNASSRNSSEKIAHRDFICERGVA